MSSENAEARSLEEQLVLLQRQLEEQRRQIEQERREKEHERREKEHERREKEHERREREKLDYEHRHTTFLEYLHYLHLYHTNLTLATPSLLTTGTTRVIGKYYPKRLRLWDHFADTLQPQLLDAIQTLLADERVFERASALQDELAFKAFVGNESSVARFEVAAVERPMQKILTHLASKEEARTTYRFKGFRFTDNLRELPMGGSSPGTADGDDREERPERQRRTGPNKRLVAERTPVHPPSRPDGLGMRTPLDGDDNLVFVYDYKAAHQVSLERIRPATANENLFREVVARINGNKISNDPDLKKQHEADTSIAMALTQVFDYMITHGVSYGYVDAGLSLLLLFVDRHDLQTLYCHPCVPSDVDADQPSRTAIAQLLAFCLLSFESEALNGPALEASQSAARRTLKTWPEPYELELEPADASSSPSSRASDDSDFVSTAGPSGRNVSLRSRSSCKAAAVLPRDDEEDEEDEDDRPEPGASRSSTAANKRKDGPPSSSSEDEDSAMLDVPTRQYCTQACLLGLKRGRDLDLHCPNVSAHRSGGSSRHPINAEQFTDLMRQQLLQNPYRKCRAVNVWRKRGAMGWLFKLELAPYGYSFVGKGTLPGRLHRLEHEGRVYARLEHLQGDIVPVHLGLVHLHPGYVLPGAVYVTHMMLLSWAGETLDASVDDADKRMMESLNTIWSWGVDHGDDCSANYLWNAERCRVMVIDFEHAVFRPNPKPRLLAKKRKLGSGNRERHEQKRAAASAEPSRLRQHLCT